MINRTLASDEHRRADAFARELSSLCRKHGIGVTGDTTLFLMEQEDHQFDYSTGPDSKLYFGGVVEA